ncbi:MAG: ABC transporter substrate-binding protein, partial [Actinobacteria bacterium]|nr:ABC transporter substrate-binding protein [Actinomycetota bacterium]
MATRWSCGVRLLALTAVAVLAAAACSSPSPTVSPTPTAAKITRGGVYRVGVSSFGNTDNLDPTGEYGIPGWGVLDALQRTLVTFRFAPGTAGTELVPDLATSVPQPSADGLTYTFHLKPGIKFGPPLNRPITSADVAYAFERINTKSLVAQYGFYYYGVIKG